MVRRWCVIMMSCVSLRSVDCRYADEALLQVAVVERRLHLVEDVERRVANAVHREQQRDAP